MSLEVRPYSVGKFEKSVMELNKKAWVLFKYNKDYEHQKMSCVLNEDGNLIAVGYLRHGLSEDHNVMEVVIEVNQEAFERFSEVRKVLYPSLINICYALRNPEKKTKMVVWNDFDGDRAFYEENGFNDYQTYYFANRMINRKSLAEIEAPIGVKVRHHLMKTEDERMSYVSLENQYYNGVVYWSLNMLEWMIAGPELQTISAFEGDEMVGSVTCWQTGAIDRLFVIPRWRNKGLGKYLIAKAFDYHLANGRTNVQTLVNDLNIEGKQLLESMGYRFPDKMELLARDI
ncbi:GNAT family N-acetyltransferase [Lederbergia panacisoli]|uniref:GNAT family N-acetyltransferase n=1 Tax=Lederbergia panacisoli TaxID=1255251 RepID=UPI00214B908E|nr:GNAT family N-acetyltransferase [Lederbergia panacisoli]MCR2822802.1 GNAT family N-acetyltransferase [Lederbergia panacisoli]